MEGQYLPSSGFVKKAGLLLVLVAVIFLIAKVTPYIQNKFKANPNSKILVKDVIYNDSNVNGIQDWEEKLWGLDPKGDGPSNKELINAKKKSLAIETENSETLTNNDKMSREFFALVMSLQDSGISTEDALAKVSEQIGQKIEIVPLKEVYKYKDIVTVPPTKKAINKYYADLKSILDKYKDRGIGSEMNLLALALDHDDKSLISGFLAIQSGYFDMIKEIANLKVPNEIASTDLVFLNNLHGSATALTMVSNVFDDSIAGLTGIATYKKNSDDAANALTDITKYIGDAIIN